ncbi:hypothetical protein JW921_10655, partial [Candidatus Fermentibacterales bacterium]|nr:hypothetical protein [Candidatus Fermentibacterales bacterium]
MPAILGINCYKHDSAAALLVDGRLVGAAEEERFTRIKHYSGYPSKTVDFLLGEAGLEARDIDHVAFYMLPGLVFRENMLYSRHYLHEKAGLAFLAGQLNGARRMAAIPATMREHLGSGLRARFHFVEHHRAHAAGAFYFSGLERAAVLTMDGVGERDCSILGTIGPQGLRVLARSRYPNSPGVYYSAVTRHLGFEPDSDEYKVMGLSSYGRPEQLPLFRRILGATSDGRIRLDTGLLYVHRGVHESRFRRGLEARVGVPRRRGQELEAIHEDVACSAQRALEETGLALARWLRDRTGERDLVIAGGVGLNCVMNGLIERESGFGGVFPMAASHDAGTSVGAAVLVHMREHPDIRLESPGSCYLGPGYGDREVESAMESSRLSCEKPADLAGAISGLLEEGRIVALFQGRMEFGPRALGNRSILADPRPASMKDRVNSVVKHREGFRPFAPSCLEEIAPDYFEGCSSSPYMIKTYDVRPGMRESIAAVTHVDGTARVQTVSREANPFYWEV